MIWTFHINLNEAIAWKGAKIFGTLFTIKDEWKTRRKLLKNIELRGYFSLYLPIYIMETYSKSFRITL